MATIYIDTLGEQEIVYERGLIREVITRRNITDWWDATIDGAPVALGEAANRLFYEESFPSPGDRLVTAGGTDIMANRPIYLIDMTFNLQDSNRGDVEMRFEYLGATADQWVDVDGSMHQIQTHFDREQNPIIVTATSSDGATVAQGVEVPVNQPRRRCRKTYGRFLQPGETQNSLVASYLGKINATQYLEGEPGTWLVTNMTVTTKVEALGLGRLPLVQITVEIEHDSLGYKYLAAWRDPFTSFIGVDLVLDEGIKRVDWHDEIEFEPEFGS